MKRSPPPLLNWSFLIADAAIFNYATFKTVEAVLLWSESPLWRYHAWMWASVGLLLLVGLERVYTNRLASPTSRPSRPLWEALAFLLLAVAIPRGLPLVPPTISTEAKSSMHFLWLPIEWHKLPHNIELIARHQAAFAALVGALLPLLLAAALRAPRIAALACVGVALAVASRLTREDIGFRAPFYQAVFAAPWAILALCALRGAHRGFARLLPLTGAFLVLWAFYTGLLPLKPSRLPLPSGVEVVYPRPGESSKFPLQYVRALWLDPDRHELYGSYGPTSGLFRIHVPTGQADLLETPGVIRHFWASTSDPTLLALEWIYDDLIHVERAAFQVGSRTHLMDGVIISPIDLIVSARDLFVLSTELPAVTRLDRATLSRVAQTNFKQLGLTQFSSGAWTMALDNTSGRLFVQLGMTDLSDRFLMVELDTSSLGVRRTMDLPAGGLELKFLPDHRTLLLPDFYSDLIYELDVDAWTIRRSIPAVANARSLAYDPRRGLLFAASFMSGDLDVIRHSDGARIRRINIGSKPSSMHYDEVGEDLYVASSRGVLRLRLSEFLEEPQP
ncbi:MAG: hypothetical protein HYY13_05575 [Nitrospirae bacterium]|nr:hypothetical protein [Nitrospirota bacterium]